MKKVVKCPYHQLPITIAAHYNRIYSNYSADKSSDQSSPRNPVTLGPDYLVSPGQAGEENYQGKREET